MERPEPAEARPGAVGAAVYGFLGTTTIVGERPQGGALMTADPWLAAIVVLVVVVVIACVWAVIDSAHAAPTVQPLVAAHPAIAPRCQAAHCGLPAFTTAPHVDGTDMWVCPDDLERGYREGWLVPVVFA